MKQGKATYIFPGANTASGYRSFFRECLNGMEQVFILKGGPGCGKSTLIRGVGELMRERGHDVEFWQCSSDVDSLDGVLIPALKAAILDGTPPHVVEPQYPGAVEELVDLGVCWDQAELKKQRTLIRELSGRIGGKYQQCWQALSEASDLLEQGKADGTVSDEDKARLLEGVFGQEEANLRHLFASSITPRGWVSFLEPLSERAGRRFILAGPYGGGREELLEAVAREAERRHIYAELYHHPLAPEKLQMVWLPDLDTALLAADFAPSPKEGDVTIDCGHPQNEGQEQEYRRRIRELTDLGGSHIAEAKALHDRLEECYIKAMDYTKVDEIKACLLSRLLALDEG